MVQEARTQSTMNPLQSLESALSQIGILLLQPIGIFLFIVIEETVILDAQGLLAFRFLHFLLLPRGILFAVLPKVLVRQRFPVINLLHIKSLLVRIRKHHVAQQPLAVLLGLAQVVQISPHILFAQRIVIQRVAFLREAFSRVRLVVLGPRTQFILAVGRRCHRHGSTRRRIREFFLALLEFHLVELVAPTNDVRRFHAEAVQCARHVTGLLQKDLALRVFVGRGVARE
mmetsp:Transcript_10323/g.28405  ORF Transcript_10323/g.28405 Transcript_10323/m.28405 type:complete len:229 (+) Transcript_10323:132-818(+)